MTYRRRDDLVVSTPDSGLSGLGSSPVFWGRILYSHSVQMDSDVFNAGGGVAL